MSAPVAVLALRPTARALPRRFTTAAALAALGSVLVLHRVPNSSLLGAGMFLAIGAAPVFDDRAATTLASSATPRWVQRGIRLGLVLPTLGCAWLLLLAVSGLLAPASAEVHFALATWHWVGMVAVVLTISCLASALDTPTFDGSAGVAGLLSVLVADVMALRLWPKLGVFLLAEPAVTGRLQLRMAGLVVMAALALAISARDPARPH